MLWCQGPSNHGVLRTSLSEMSEFLATATSNHVSLDQTVGTANGMDAVG